MGSTEFEYRQKRCMTTGVRLLGELLDRYRREHGVDVTRGGYSLLVSADGAAFFLREVFGGHGVFAEVTVDDTPDTLFLYRQVPVRMRLNAAPGQCYVMKDRDLPRRTCCDEASQTSIVVALTRANA